MKRTPTFFKMSLLLLTLFITASTHCADADKKNRPWSLRFQDEKGTKIVDRKGKEVELFFEGPVVTAFSVMNTLRMYTRTPICNLRQGDARLPLRIFREMINTDEPLTVTLTQKPLPQRVAALRRG